MTCRSGIRPETKKGILKEVVYIMKREWNFFIQTQFNPKLFKGICIQEKIQ